jgi:hypothetical protein
MYTWHSIGIIYVFTALQHNCSDRHLRRGLMCVWGFSDKSACILYILN